MAGIATKAIGKATLALGIDPVTATVIRNVVVGAGGLAPLVGTGLDVVGTLREGTAIEQQSRAEQALAEQQAAQEELRGIETERIRRKEGEKLKSRQRAQFAKGGVRVGEGTPLLVMAETILDTEEDISAIRQGTTAAASGFRLTGQTFRSIGKSAKRTSRIKAGASLISGLSDL